MTQTPYLSVVATARNDNHGGNMLRRMQIFVNGLLEQCRRHQLAAELIIVEWNPPIDQPSLAESLSWSIQDSLCTVRFVEVPPAVHQQLKYAEALPLFQMIAKNVGIRRARGEYILATNIDLLFSDALMEFIASRQLQPGKVYRMDRYDVWSDVPLEASIEDQLNYCQNNILRICGKDGIREFAPVTPADSETDTDEAVNVLLPTAVANSVPPATNQLSPVLLPLLKQTRQIYKSLLPTDVRDRILGILPLSSRHWLIQHNLLTVQPPPPPPPVEVPTPRTEEPMAEERMPWEQLPTLHTNACGDFTLMSRADWFAIRAYPEWELFSFHLDSVLMYTAHFAGIEEVILEDPMRTYHIEHASGWTPEAERTQTLNRRLKKLKIPQLSMDQLTAMAMLMQQLGKPLIFNDEDWGMIKQLLPEKVIDSSAHRSMVNTSAAIN